MTIQEHYENFMSQPDVEQYVELYCLILENMSDDQQDFYYGLLNEVTKDRALFDALMVEKIKTYH